MGGEESEDVVDFELETVDDNINVPVTVTDTVPETDLVTEAVFKFVAEPMLDDPTGHE